MSETLGCGAAKGPKAAQIAGQKCTSALIKVFLDMLRQVDLGPARLQILISGIAFLQVEKQIESAASSLVWLTVPLCSLDGSLCAANDSYEAKLKQGCLFVQLGAPEA